MRNILNLILQIIINLDKSNWTNKIKYSFNNHYNLQRIALWKILINELYLMIFKYKINKMLFLFKKKQKIFFPNKIIKKKKIIIMFFFFFLV